MQFAVESWNVTVKLAPWLLLGCLVAGLLKVVLPANFMTKHLGGRGFGSVFRAVMLGVPMPLCSCGVIPTAIGIRKQGASDGASVGFLISTPQTGVDSVLVSAAFLGWPFALFKVGCAFITGLIGGALTQATTPDEAITPAEAKPAARTDQSKIRVVYEFAINDLLRSIWRWVALGVGISVIISIYASRVSDATAFLGTGIVAMIAVLVISLPMYVCATSSVPIAAALVAAGFPPGAALVFLMAGPASNIATIGAIYRAFGKRVLGIYLGTITIFSLFFGYLFSFVLKLKATVPMHHEHVGWWGIASAVVLLLLFTKFIVEDIRTWLSKRAVSTVVADVTINLTVNGMTCNGCANRLRNGLLEIPGISDVDIDLETKAVAIRGSDFTQAATEDRVRALGFEVA